MQDLRQFASFNQYLLREKWPRITRIDGRGERRQKARVGEGKRSLHNDPQKDFWLVLIVFQKEREKKDAFICLREIGFKNKSKDKVLLSKAAFFQPEERCRR